MPLYLSRFRYTTETWQKIVADPQDRSENSRKGIESLGGKQHGLWYSFGSQDGYTMFEMPDHVKMAGNILAVKTGGAVESIEIDTLLTPEEMVDAMKLVEQVTYSPKA